MKKQATVWMALLTLTGIVLAVILLSTGGQREARGAMLNAQPKFSLMTSGVPAGDESLIIVDKETQKMLIYRMNGNALELIAGINLGR